MLYRSKKDADYSVNDPIGGPDEINRKDSRRGLVWLASYPKSGNTWARVFLHNLVSETGHEQDINSMHALTTTDNAAGWYKDLLLINVTMPLVVLPFSPSRRRYPGNPGQNNTLIW